MISVNEINVKNILTPSRIPGFDYTINPYVGCTHRCVYCYAEFMAVFTKHQEKWGDFVDIKNHHTQFTKKKLHGKSIIMSTVTDPYLHFEAKYYKTRKILEQLLLLQKQEETEFSLQILTKSSMVLRDLDLLTQFSTISVGVSLNSTDDQFQKLIEPQASSVSERIKTVKELHQAGIHTQLFSSPIFPYITNISLLYKELKDDVDIWCFENLNLRGAYRKRVLDLIKQHYPQYYQSYLKIYAKREDNKEFWDQIHQNIKEKFAEIPHNVFFYHSENKNI